MDAFKEISVWVMSHRYKFSVVRTGAEYVCVHGAFSKYCAIHGVGVTHDTYSSKFRGCVYMNLEYTSGELYKTLSWVILSSLNPPPLCAIDVYPRWKMEKIHGVAYPPQRQHGYGAHQTHTLFLCPNHWEYQRKASPSKWRMMVIEIFNDAGRARFCTETPIIKINKATPLTSAKMIAMIAATER